MNQNSSYNFQVTPIFTFIFYNKIYFIFIFYSCWSTVVSIFTTPCTPATPIPTSYLPTYPLWLCLFILYTCSLMALPLLSSIIPLPLLSGYLQFVLYFNVSGCILLACLLFPYFLEREEGRREGEKVRGREGERNISWLPSSHVRSGDWTCILGMCPDWEMNLQPSGVWGKAPTNWLTWGRVQVVWLTFPRWLVMMSIFSCTCWAYVCLLWEKKCLFRSSSHFLIVLFFCFIFHLYEFLIYFEY